MYGGGGLGLVPGARNAWSYWIDHILKQRERFGFVAAMMITTRGAVSAFTKDFLPATAEVQVKLSLNKVHCMELIHLQSAHLGVLNGYKVHTCDL